MALFRAAQTTEEVVERFAAVKNDLDTLANDCSHLTHAEVSEWAESMRHALEIGLRGLGLYDATLGKQAELYPDDEDNDDEEGFEDE